MTDTTTADRLQLAIDAARNLCNSYATVPPPIFRDPPTDYGKGHNAGTRNLALAILETIATALHDGPWCDTCDGRLVRAGEIYRCQNCGDEIAVESVDAHLTAPTEEK